MAGSAHTGPDPRHPAAGRPLRAAALGGMPSVARALATALLAAVLAVGLLPPLAGASEPEDGEIVVDADTAGVREEPEWAPGNQGLGLWFWPEGNRVYQLTDAQASGWSTLKAYHADTLTPAAPPKATLSPTAFGSSVNQERYSAHGRHHLAAVDREHGRVFVAYKTTAVTLANHPGDPPCPDYTLVAAGHQGCVSGVHVRDGESLESLGRIALDLPTVEGVRAVPIPRALEYAQADPRMGWGGRVLMLVEDVAHGPLENSDIVNTFGSPPHNASLRRSSGNVAYVVAFDPEGMRQEWAVRVEGCRNSRAHRGWSFEREGHPATVFRTGGADPALYVGCHANPAGQGVVVRVPLDEEGIPAALPLRAGDPVTSADSEAADGGPGGVIEPAPRQEVFPGPDSVTVILSDPASRRILMRVDDAGEVWWVFDGRANQYLGTIGIGDYAHGQTTYGLDPDVGRLYVAAARSSRSPGGLYVADIRRNPVAQALHYSHLAPFAGGDKGLGETPSDVGRVMSVQPRAGNAGARVFVTKDRPDQSAVFRVVADDTPVSVDPAPADEVVRTLDLDEIEGATAATFDGTARAFGFRAILLGGLEGAARLGSADPVGWVRGVQEFKGRPGGGGTGEIENVVRVLPPPDPCTDAQRELIVAFVGPEGPAVVDASSARGEAQPVLADVRTREDVAAPVTRCGPTDWPELWRTAMVSQPPASEPGVSWPFDESRSSCTATDGDDRDSWSDPVAGAFASQVDCSEDEVGGWGQARGLSVDGVSVANTLSSFRIYRDPKRGLVARVESVARGIDLGGVVKIDTIRGVAESWANGRSAGGFHDPDLERELGLAADDDSDDPDGGDDATPADGEEEFNPFNCDTARPAGTCFERHVFGVTVSNPDNGEVWRCGPCGPEDDFVEAMNRGFGANALARFREPDPALARGSEDGYVAAITKKDEERFADVVLNADLLETMVPMLEVIRYAPHNRQSMTDVGESHLTYFSTGTPPRGRQVYQFAAVEVSSTYGIQCLLEYDPATNVCAEPAVPASSLTVELLDGDGAALAGGAFEVRRDIDGDGVLGLVDELVENGACATGPDGVCAFDGLEPGAYLVSQTAAPDGYAPVDEALAVNLFPGDDLTVTFTNVPNFSTITLTVTDLDGAPVEGAVFGVFPDADYVAASVSAEAVEPVATCTTDADGVCSMTVPPGAYVLRQLSAPDGLLPIDDIAFVIDQAGQTADVALTLGAAGTDPVPVAEPAAGPVDDFAPAPVPLAQPAVSIAPAPARSAPSVTSTPPAMSEPPPAIAEQVGGTIIRVIRSPANALRLAARSPIEAASLIMVLLLVGLAIMAVARRQQLATLLAVPPVPGGGHGPGAGPRPPGSPDPDSDGSGNRGPGNGGPGGGWSSGGGPRGGSPGDGGTGSAPPTSPPPGAPSPAGGGGPASATGAPTAYAATAVLERPTTAPPTAPPVVAGAAPSPTERATVRVVVATAAPALAALATQRLAAADRCDLLAAVDSLEDLRAVLAETQPEVLVVDLALPTGDVLDLCDLLPGLHPPERTVGLIPPQRSMTALAVRGHTAGLGGMLAADDDIGNGNLAYAVRAVAAGRVSYGPAVQTALLEHWGDRPRKTNRVAAGLTPRELEVARLAAAGIPRAQIAKGFHVAPATVKEQLRSVRAKLGVTDPRDIEQLRRRLAEAGLLDDD